MSARELAAVTKQFDKPFVIDRSRALTREERRRWQRVKRNRGRPKTGQGFRRISVSIEGGLLKKVTALARSAVPEASASARLWMGCGDLHAESREADHEPRAWSPFSRF